ncbi:MAG: sialate O-acetylesterase [Candidatus Solibacter sp.]
MMKQAIPRTITILTALAAFTSMAFAADPLPFVSPIFGDNMVLQRGKLNTIWGWSQAGDTVKVEIEASSATGTAGANGKWQVQIQPPAPGGPYTVKISGKQIVELKDVLVGDVWLCGGQSNMQFGLRQARNGAEEVKNANYPQIRFYVVGEKASYNPQDVPRAGSWKAVTPEGLAGRGGISAVGYFFGRKLHLDTKVPIGLIHEAVGGVPAETFASPDALRPLKDFDAGLAELEKQRQKGGKEYGNYIMHWYDDYDIGSRNGSWAEPALDEASWKPVQIPGTFKELGVDDVPSLMWLRKEITLPDPLPAGNGRVLLGSVDKMDTVYINGQQIGSSSWVENPRAYFARGLKPGKNVIAIRLLNTSPGKGGFISGADSLKLVLGETTISLAGEWKGKVAVDGHSGATMPPGYESVTSMASVLYNGMLAPIAPLAITGAIWYQGESNAARGYQYRKVLPAMIADWRKLFGQGDFPFYIVGLPAYQKRKSAPGDDGWAETREAQFMTTKSVPNTCLATTIDTGDADNIHPIDKVEVGDRLAACALAGYYKQKVPFSGPTLAKVEKGKGGEMKVHFDHTDGGLVVKGEKTGEFSIAGEDHKWYWADARVDGNTVIVSSPSVPNPVAVRYAWQANPLASLYNGAGLPAVPFRTDDWPGVTLGKIIY